MKLLFFDVKELLRKSNVKFNFYRPILEKELYCVPSENDYGYFSIVKKNMINKDIEKIAKKVIEKETEYYLKKYKIKTSKEFLSLFEKISQKEISKIRRKIVEESIIEFSKNG